MNNYDPQVEQYAQETLQGQGGVSEPVFIQTTEPGKVQDGVPFVERQAVVCIVKHWSEDAYIGLKWKKVDWQTLVTGGLELGQTCEQAGFAEIEEETGYKDITFVKDLGVVHSKFFHVPKQENRFAHSHVLYFELQSSLRQDVSDQENQIHELAWIPAVNMGEFVNNASHKYAWSLFCHTMKS